MKEACCNSCKKKFSVSSEEESFLKKMDLPCPPRNCPDCRRQRRLAFRNERRMFHRVCDESGRRVVAVYPQETKQKLVMYEQSLWWDYQKMDPLSFGRDFDFSRPFFSQFAELKEAVPHPNLHNTNVENAQFGNHCVSNKNCYLTIASDICEDCYYTYWAIRCRDCYDCSLAYDCELCYSCVDVRLCYNCEAVVNSENMTDCGYCYDSKGCFDCFGCVGIRHKTNFFLNQPLSETDYRLKLKELRNNKRRYEEFLLCYEQLKRNFAQSPIKNIQSEGVIGDRLWRCRDCKESFDLERCHDVNHSTFGFDGISCQDIDFFGRSEMMYEGFSAFGQYNCISTILCHFSHDAFYSEYCISSHHVLGCVCLHHQDYCILNKQYSKEEWEILMPKIVSHMKKTGEWGEFFPVETSPFPYNYTVAQKYYPLSEEEIKERGWWYKKDDLIDREQQINKSPELLMLPENDSEVDISICRKPLRCERTGRVYQIMPKEFEYLRARNIPLPRIHQDERNELRMAQRNPQRMWKRSCVKCSAPIETAYDPSGGWQVCCTSCYEKSL